MQSIVELGLTRLTWGGKILMCTVSPQIETESGSTGFLTLLMHARPLMLGKVRYCAYEGFALVPEIVKQV
jgi:hypothetical protein